MVGLAAKPIVDIMAGVASSAGSRSAIAAVAAHGYCHHSYAADVEHWFCMPSPELRTHRLHLVPVHSELWQQRLMFRDALRARPALAAEYARLKVELAEQHRFDREVYTQAKSAFIRGVLREVARGDILQRAKVTDEADLEGTEPGAVRGLRAPPNTHRADIPRLRAAVFGELEIRYVYNASAQRSAEV